ncbi:MAG: hypothetical protein CBC47_07990 [Alphaproteobacteria bacterium TMED87]|nr:peptidase M23 [Rhodospirillaceae bacterium]OUV08119.1 MAG: hypothetical protein CBC47_07990 [Alphaproteobacteria bacterium TMED87]
MFLNCIKYIFPIFIISACTSKWEPPSGYVGGDFMEYGEVKEVRVKKGQSIYILSKLYGISMRSIIEENNLTAPFILYPNQRIMLRPPNAYIVRRGDSLYSIAKKYGTNVYQLAKQNSIDAPYTIFSGQKILVPYKIIKKTSEPLIENTVRKQKPRKNNKLIEQTKLLNESKKRVVSIQEHNEKRKNQFSSNIKNSQIFIWPVQGEITSQFGPGGKGLHNDGINILVPEGSDVVASESGVVVYSGNELQGFGNLLLIKHSNGWMTAYGHNDQLLVSRGDKVKKGQIISYSGSSGNVRIPQLHFEIRKGTKAVDPLKYLNL